MLQHEVVVPILEASPGSRVKQTTGQAATIAGRESVANDAAGSSAMSRDDLLVAQIHEAIVAGRLTRNLASICKFREC